jgi:hypothetical protein
VATINLTWTGLGSNLRLYSQRGHWLTICVMPWLPTVCCYIV